MSTKVGAIQGVEPIHDEPTFVQELSEVLSSITNVTIFIEHREVISPKLFRVFRSALHSTHHDLLEALKRPEMEMSERFDLASKAASNASNYCSDLNACLQNDAFGDLFENEAPIRKPIDPSLKVLVNDDAVLDELLQYFEHETAYGINMDETNARVTEEFGGK